MALFPRVEKLLDSGEFGANHFAANLDLGDPIVPALEYFLSLEHVDGFSGKLHELGTKPVGTARTNSRYVQWASMCAELGAICLLGRILRITLVGFDKPSPNAKRPRSNCDLVARIDDRLVYVEVKRNASEDSQLLPELLASRLQELAEELNIGITGQLLDRRYDCSDIDEKLARIREHVQAHRAAKRGEPRQYLPLGAFRIELSNDDMSMELFTPPSPEDVRKKLLGPGGVGRDGEPMQPFVVQAVGKGADYLFLRTPKIDGADWGEIVQALFPNQTYKCGSDRLYITSDQGLQGLRGIVLFHRYDEFCIIGGSIAETEMWAPYAAAP